MVRISEAEYNDALDNYLGWCVECNAFTRESTEPDAQGYECPDCGNECVYGAEDAMISGEFDIVEGEE